MPQTEAGLFLTSCARTDVGMRRQNNEDAYVLVDLDVPDRPLSCLGERFDISGRRLLLALSDGMGGATSGDVASKLALTTLTTTLRQNSLGRPDQQLEAAVQVANATVHQAAVQQGRHGMGATLTAVLIQDGVAWIAEVGDSRAYLLRNRTMKQLTHDQSYVQMLIDIGAIKPEDAAENPQKNVILQAVGTATHLEVALGWLSLRRGDRLLLCSDGLSNELADEELAQLLGEATPAITCERAIARANQAGGRDNVTAIVAMFDGDGLPPPIETITATHKVLQEFRQ